MATATEVQLEDSKQAQGGRQIPRIYKTRWVLGIFLLVSLWILGAFIRGRGYSRLLQMFLLVAAMALLAGLGWLTPTIVRRQSMLNREESARILAFSSSAFLLLAVFLPEYLLGRPLLARSFILLIFSLALFAMYFAVSLRAERPALNSRAPVSAGKVLFLFCVVYFVATSWITLSKLHAFGYVGQDIAYFAQCLYTTLHGHLFYSNMYHDLLYGKPVTS